METLIRALRAYQPYNRQEEVDKQTLLRLMESGEEILSRSNLKYHLTASAWIVSPDRSLALMAYHNIYQSWSWLGGHADGEADLLSVAMREACEESGLKQVRAISDDIFSVEILVVEGHEKKGDYVPCHLHLNVTYLLEADPMEPLHLKADENSGVKWFLLEEAVRASNEKWFRERIYRKLNDKLKGMK